MTVTDAFAAARVAPYVPRRQSLRIVERNALAYRRLWPIFMAGFAEPIFFLFSIGIGVGELVGDVVVSGVGPVPYDEFVAPGMLAAAAMNGAVFDTTFSFFVKFKYWHTYDAILATPMGVRDIAVGEVTWALLRGFVYSAAFLATMWALDLVHSPWAVLTLPATVLIGAAFASAGLAGSTWLRSFIDFDLVQLAVVPQFLFSATFFPLDRYPGVFRYIVQITPLYQGVDLCRALCLGDLRWNLLLRVLYLVVMTAVGVRIANRRLTTLLTG